MKKMMMVVGLVAAVSVVCGWDQVKRSIYELQVHTLTVENAVTLPTATEAKLTLANNAPAAVPVLAASSNGITNGYTNAVSVQVRTAGGSNLASRRVVDVWVSTTAFGAPSTNNVTSVTLSGGTAIQTVTANASYRYMTGTNGTATATIVGTAAGTNYVMSADGGTVASQAVTFL